jgi:histidinol-phosphate phosphatase family protein
MAGRRGDRVDAVVLAGGKGTRSADPTVAKLAQEVGGSSLMQWHLRLVATGGLDRVIVVAGHLGEQVQRLSESLDYGDVAVEVVHEEKQRGTVAAVALGATVSDADRFLVILGDILMSLPLQDFLEGWVASGRAVGVVAHPSTHPEDSDAVFPSHDGSVIVAPKGQRDANTPNMSSAGLFAITRAGLDAYGHLRDVGSDVLPAAAAADDLYCFVTSHYLRDTGTPDRLSGARDDVARGAFARRGSLEPRPALFLDRDGVLNPGLPEVYAADDYRLLPGVADAVKHANRLGMPAFVVTNQPGIAKGFMTMDEHLAIRARMDHLLAEGGAFVDDYLHCPHHPETGFQGEVAELKGPCACRKPGIAMAEEVRDHHRIALSESVMVGDTERDRGFARAAGMRFVHVSAGCDSCEGEDCVPEAAEAIRRGIEAVLC